MSPSTQDHDYIIKNSRALAYVCALFTVLMGVLGLYGWVIEDNLLKQGLIPTGMPIATNTFLGLALVGLGLIFHINPNINRWLKTFGKLFSISAIVLGVVTLIEYFADIDLGIDQAFFAPKFHPNTDLANRMGLYTSVNLVAKGLAIVWLDWATKQGRRPSQYLSVLTLILPIHSLLNWLYGSRIFSDFSPGMSVFYMAAMNAVAWIVMSIGTLYARPTVGLMSIVNSRTASGKFIRRLLVPAVIIPAVLGWFIVYGQTVESISKEFGASLLAVVSLVIFVFIIWQTGNELYESHVQRDRVEKELVAAKESAEEANRTKSAFLANMSHEIRSPLGVMLGFAELLSDPNCSKEERSRFIQIMKRNVKALTTIIDDILDISKVEAGKLKIERARINFLDLISDLNTVNELLCREKDISFSTTIEGKIPKYIFSDPVRVKQVLSNIIGNAVKFTEFGSVRLKVASLEKPAEDAVFVNFEISDTGPGIAPANVPKLFRPFMQADSSVTRKFGGSGLGLALSRSLALALGGDLQLIRSEIGNGSSFLVTIFAGRMSEIQYVEPKKLNGAVRMQSSEKTHLEVIKRLQGLKVLLADDADDNRLFVKKLLSLDGAEVDLAENGEEAVEMALRTNPDVVLMDIQMPQMDGVQATKALRSKGFAKPVLALTAHAMREDRKRSLESGFDDHLSKPIQREILVKTLERYLAEKPSAHSD